MTTKNRVPSLAEEGCFQMAYVHILETYPDQFENEADALPLVWELVDLYKEKYGLLGCKEEFHYDDFYSEDGSTPKFFKS